MPVLPPFAMLPPVPVFPRFAEPPALDELPPSPVLPPPVVPLLEKEPPLPVLPLVVELTLDPAEPDDAPGPFESPTVQPLRRTRAPVARTIFIAHLQRLKLSDDAITTRRRDAPTMCDNDHWAVLS
jgi:hypothetical protein